MGIKIEEIIKETKRLIDISKTIETNTAPQKSGGYLTLGYGGFEKKKVLPIGDFPEEKAEKYFRLSQEKAHRVYSDWLRNPNETISSYQTRNPEENKWGGAVLFNKDKGNIVSFSGLSEIADEALSLSLGFYLELMQDESYEKEFEKIVKISNNNIFYEMFSKFIF